MLSFAGQHASLEMAWYVSRRAFLKNAEMVFRLLLR
jgi:hypothetical protein